MQRFKMTNTAPTEWGYYWLSIRGYDTSLVKVMPFKFLSTEEQNVLLTEYESGSFNKDDLIVYFFDDNPTTVNVLSDDDYEAKWSERMSADNTYDLECPSCGRKTWTKSLVEENGKVSCITCVDEQLS